MEGEDDSTVSMYIFHHKVWVKPMRVTIIYLHGNRSAFLYPMQAWLDQK